MADSTIAALSAATALDGTELYYGVQAGGDTKVTGAQIKTLVLAGATTQLGAADAASPVAQTLDVQSVVTGTSNTAGADFTIAGSKGTGTGAGGDILFQTANTGTTGTAQNATELSLKVGSNFTGFYQPSNNSGRRAWVLEGDGGLGLKLRRWSDNFGTALSAVWEVNGSVTTDTFQIDCDSLGFVGNSGIFFFGTDLFFTRGAAATLQFGKADAAAPIAQTIQTQSVVAGTTDTAGTDWTLRNSLGTGTGASGNFINKTGFSAKSTGTSQHTSVDRDIIVAKGKVLTSAAAFSMFDVALPTLSMCGGVIEATIVCSNGTDMQSFTQTVTYSAVNKGGVYTASISPSTGDKSLSAGTLSTAWSIVSGTNKVTIKVTPTTSLTPSTNAFLLYYTVRNNSEQATTIL